MVDLHSHILMQIDDGAKSIDESVNLIRMEIDSGVDTIALTPHFNFDNDQISEFKKRREKAWNLLTNELEKLSIGIKIILAAEVLISPKIIEEKNIRELCYTDTNYMLLEFPFSNYPDWIPHVLYQLKLQGITPVIAHVERYPYIKKHPEILEEIVDNGSVTQANASSLILDTRRTRNDVLKYIKQDLIHTIATDTHSVKHRPPVLDRAMKLIEAKTGHKMAEYLKENSRMISSNLSLGTF